MAIDLARVGAAVRENWVAAPPPKPVRTGWHVFEGIADVRLLRALPHTPHLDKRGWS